MNIACIKNRDTTVDSNLALIVALVLALGGMTKSAPAFAQQSSAMTAVYGRGVHAYFAGDTSVAEQYFTQVIEAKSTDPRPYYYRAMLRLGMGRPSEAEADMRVGAAFEARNPGMQGSIGRALERVQGPGRRTLEKFRRQARLDRLQRGQRQTQQRYEQLNRRGPQVLRRPARLPLGQPIQPPQNLGAPRVTAPPQVQAPALTTPQPAAPTPSESGTNDNLDDPFGTPAPVTPADDPFGTSSTPAEVEEEPMPETSGDDPFGEETDAPAEADDSDPFGESTEDPDMESEEPAEESSNDDADPFGESTESSDNDPFGDSTEESSEPEEEDSSEPEDDEDDPFDPFGSATPRPADIATAKPNSASASDPTMASPAGQFFFQLGQWIGSRTSQATTKGPPGGAAARTDAVSQAGFELGPTEDNQTDPAAVEIEPEGDPFGEGEPATDKPEEEPMEDDPFGDF